MSKQTAYKMKTGIELIAEERQRQIEVEGYSIEHDLMHSKQELAIAATCYATPSEMRETDNSFVGVPKVYPWGCCWKPTPENRVKELVKAGALIAAEIDRLQEIKRK